MGWVLSFFLEVSPLQGDGRGGTFRWDLRTRRYLVDLRTRKYLEDLRTRRYLERSGVWTEERSKV